MFKYYFGFYYSSMVVFWLGGATAPPPPPPASYGHAVPSYAEFLKYSLSPPGFLLCNVGWLFSKTFSLLTTLLGSGKVKFGRRSVFPDWYGTGRVPHNLSQDCRSNESRKIGAAQGEGLPPLLLGYVVHTFDFLYERTHSRKRSAYKNVILSKCLMHFQPFQGIKFYTFSGGTCPPPPPPPTSERAPRLL